MSAPEADLEQNSVYKVDWGKVTSGNFFNDDELEPKDLESTEAIDYVRKVLQVVALQMAGMAAASFLCNFLGLFKALVGNTPILYLSALCVIVFFVALSFKPELRTTAPLNYTFLLAGSISMIVFYGAISGKVKAALIVTTMVAISCASAGLYLGVRLAKSSTNREYLIRKMFVGACAGFLTCIALMMWAMSAFKFSGKSSTFISTMIIYLLAVTYLGYVAVFVVLPGHADHKDDTIWGVIRMYIQSGIVVMTLTIIAFNKLCGNKNDNQ